MRKGQIRRPNGAGSVYKRTTHAGWRAEVVIAGRRYCFDAPTRQGAENRLRALIYTVPSCNELWQDVVIRAQELGDRPLLAALRAYAIAVRGKRKA